MNNIFYTREDMKLDDKVNIINFCKDICYNWWVDKLDCNQSFMREKIDMSFSSIMEKFDNSSHFVIIHREGIQNIEPSRLEVGFSTDDIKNNLSYFLWIEVEENKIPLIVDKYDLIVRK